jgi:CHAD domain-containing protein
MSDEYFEREDKYDVASDFALPDLKVDGLIDKVDAATYHLEATYFDTEEDFLGRHRITLRKRKGGKDAGWHLKLPGDAGRTEVQVQSRAGSVPRELSALLLGIRRGRPLVARVTLSTTRNAHLLSDASGQALAEVADDSVHVIAGSDGQGVPEWREIEVELGPAGDESLLELLGRPLRDAGAQPSKSPSKYARARGDLPLDTPLHKGLAGLVDAYLQAQYTAIFEGDLALRREVNAVHTTRVAVRRLRSTVRTFGKVFDSEAAGQLEAELVWIAAVLGEVRDLDVLRDRLTGEVDALPGEYVLGPVASRVESTLTADREAAYRRLRKVMNAKRYLVLLELLESWRTHPPFTERARKPKKTASSYVATAERKMLKQLHRAVQPGAAAELLHKARKAEKRYRYAAELAQPVLGARSDDAIKKAKRLQKLLGEFQDAVVGAKTLRRLGATAGSTEGENGFTYGLLLAQEWEVQRAVREQVVHDYG